MNTMRARHVFFFVFLMFKYNNCRLVEYQLKSAISRTVHIDVIPFGVYNFPVNVTNVAKSISIPFVVFFLVSLLIKFNIFLLQKKLIPSATNKVEIRIIVVGWPYVYKIQTRTFCWKKTRTFIRHDQNFLIFCLRIVFLYQNS